MIKGTYSLKKWGKDKNKILNFSKEILSFLLSLSLQSHPKCPYLNQPSTIYKDFLQVFFFVCLFLNFFGNCC